ncbi:MAG: hypothetical protein ACREFP_26665 [Acetobacteraceae bacterium]
MSIADNDYNRARAILVQAGSKTASKSHDKHTQGKGSKDSDGQGLLREARDEFRGTDTGQPGLQAGMTAAHYGAVHGAAQQMSITQW